MNLTNDESRALAFIAALLLLSAAVRVGAAPDPAAIPGSGAFDVAAHIEATREAVAGAERAARPLGSGERIDPNTADALELDRLPRVGPALADRIIADREQNGRFRSVEDLRRVRGVGEGLLARIRPHLALPDRAGTVPSRLGGAGTGASPGPHSAPDVATQPIDLNRADVEALTRLPGIGPVLAERIVAYRDSVGPFRDVDGLIAVRGVGPATLERLRPRITVGG